MSGLTQRAKEIKESLNLNPLYEEGILRRRTRYKTFHNMVPFRILLPAFKPERFFLSDDLQSPREVTLYLHIPFCKTRCQFCNFFSIAPQSETVVESYLKALKGEIEILLNTPLLRSMKVKELYVGGGTPTHLSPQQIRGMMRFLFEKMEVDPDAEITWEVNPKTIIRDEAKLRALKESGVSRLSIGIQSFDDDELKALKRGYDSKEAVSSILVARDAGFQRIGIDLMYGIPFQTLEKWEHALSRVAELTPDSLSIYKLRLLALPIFEVYKKDHHSFPDEEATLMMKIMATEFLLQSGYTWGYRDYFYLSLDQIRKREHSIKDYEYLSVGASAISYIDKAQHYNYSDLKRYMEAINRGRLPIHRRRRISRGLQRRREIVLGINYPEGLDKNRFKSLYGMDATDAFGSPLQQLKKVGLIEEDEKFIKLTYLGSLFNHETYAQFYNGRNFFEGLIDKIMDIKKIRSLYLRYQRGI